MLIVVLLGGMAAAADVDKWIDPQASRVRVQPNVIETGGSAAVGRTPAPKAPAPTPGIHPQAVPAPRPDIEAYVEQCRNNRGVDCEDEARAMIDGPAPVLFPGDPAVFPRPDLKPPPPGLPLKYDITP
jgi:hypothetical protein